MSRFPLMVAAAVFGLATMAASQAASPVAPPADHRLDLGRQRGDFYAVKQADGLHVIATFAEPDQNAVPVRFETVLAQGQTVTVSSPRNVGEPAVIVSLTRRGDQVDVRKVAAID